MNLALAFAQSAQSDPSKTALFWGDVRFSYDQFWKQTLVVAQQLQRSFGVKRGDRVGVWLRNCPEFVPALFGIWQAGAVAVPASLTMSSDAHGSIMTKSELIEIISAKQKHLPAKDVELAVKQLLEIMSDALATGERIEIRGFGSFSLHFRPPRQGRNPKTGEAVALAGKHVPHFKPGKDLRERVNDGADQPIRD